MVHISPILTDILTGHNVASLAARNEVVDFVVDLQPSDTAREAGVETQDVGHVLDIPHPSQEQCLVEGDS